MGSRQRTYMLNIGDGSGEVFGGLPDPNQVSTQIARAEERPVRVSVFVNGPGVGAAVAHEEFQRSQFPDGGLGAIPAGVFYVVPAAGGDQFLLAPGQSLFALAIDQPAQISVSLYEISDEEGAAGFLL